MKKYTYKKQLSSVSSYFRIFAIVSAVFGLAAPLYSRVSPVKRIENAKKNCALLEEKIAKNPSEKLKKELADEQAHLKMLEKRHDNFTQYFQPYMHQQIHNLKEDGALSIYTYHKNRGDKFLQVRTLERLVQIATDQTILAEALLALADLYYSYQHNLEKAAKTYEKFATLFPGLEQADYAGYKSIVCLFYSTLIAERDQTATADVISLAGAFLKRTSNENYKKEVQDIVAQCYQRLFDSEKSIFLFYIKQKKYGAAQKRLTYIKENFASKIENGNEEYAVLQDYLQYVQMPKAVKKTVTNPLTVQEQEKRKKNPSLKKERKSRKFL